MERINEWYEDTPFILLELDQCYQMATRAEYAQVIRQALEVKMCIRDRHRACPSKRLAPFKKIME